MWKVLQTANPSTFSVDLLGTTANAVLVSKFHVALNAARVVLHKAIPQFRSKGVLPILNQIFTLMQRLQR
jgi:hypothetical protein